MEPQRLSNKLQEDYVKKLAEKGELGLYKSVVGSVLSKWSRGVGVKNPDIEILDLAESFFSLSRATGEKKFYLVGRCLRRSAHHIYRAIRSIDKKKISNTRFLRSVG